MKPITLLLSLSLVLFISCKKNAEEEPDSDLTPTINSFSNTASIGDTLTVAGVNFPLATGSLEIYFGDNKANIISQSDKELSFVVPLLKSASCNLVMKDKNGNV